MEGKGRGGVGMEWDGGNCKLDYSQDSLSHCPHACLVPFLPPNPKGFCAYRIVGKFGEDLNLAI